MKNEEKAREIAINNRQNYFEGDIGWGANTLTSECECYDSAMAMAEWKDEQLKEQRRIIRNHWQEWAEEQKQALIDKACEWLEDNAINYVGKDGITAWRSVFADFRKAMKGGEE